MAISRIGNTSIALASGGSSFNLAQPADTQVGDVLLCFWFLRNDSSNTPGALQGSGWTTLGSRGGSGEMAGVIWRTAAAAGAVSHAFTSAGADRATAIMVAYRGAALGDATSSWSTSRTAASVTTVNPDARLVCGFGTDALNGSVAGMTLVAQRANTSWNMSVFDAVIATPGATGTRTYSGTGTGRSGSVALEPLPIKHRIRMMV